MATGKSKGYGFVSFFNKWVSMPLSMPLLSSLRGSIRDEHIDNSRSKSIAYTVCISIDAICHYKDIVLSVRHKTFIFHLATEVMPSKTGEFKRLLKVVDLQYQIPSP